MDKKVVIILGLLLLVLVVAVSRTNLSAAYISDCYKTYSKLFKPGDNVFSISKISAPTMTPGYSQKIPFIIIQTGSYPVGPSIRQASMINRYINPEYEYRFYDNADCTEYIKKHDPALLQTYNALLPGAYKADLFRCIVLYYEGGVYLDDKSTMIQPLRTYLDPARDFVAFKDVAQGACFNGFMAVAPRHPIMKMMIDRIKENVTNQYYGINALDPTGPQLLGRCINQYLGRQELDEFEEKQYSTDIDLIGTFYIINKNYQSLSDRNGTPLINRCYSGYYSLSRLLKKDYTKDWILRKNVYAQ